MVPSYIGITDFMTPAQARAMADAFRAHGGPAVCRKLARGVMMSRKTLRGLPTRWAAAFPTNEAVADIFTDDPDALNVLHYADYAEESDADDLMDAARLGGEHLHAVQLDMVWPERTHIELLRVFFPRLAVILQVGEKALDAAGNKRDAVAAAVAEYGDTIDAVLLDMSMGRGVAMKAATLIPLAEAILEMSPHLHLAAAGGLGPDTVDLAAPLLARFPRMSLDAQSRLRRSGSALDPVEWDLAERYLERAIALVASH